MDGFGKPKYGSKQNNSGVCPTFSVTKKEPEGVFRFYPVVVDEKTGRMSQYAATHWGFAGTDPQNPTAMRLRPFKCIEQVNWQTKEIKVECPQCTRYREAEAARDNQSAELRSQLNADGKTESEIEDILKTALTPANEWLRKYNCDRKHYYAVKRQKDGANGHLKVSSKTKKKIEIEFERLFNEEGVDPTSLDQGVWLSIRRIDDKGDDIVSVLTEKVDAEVNGRKVKVNQIVPAPISEEEASKALEEIRDLTTVGGYVLTAEQITLLTQSSEDPEEIDRIFAMNQTARKSDEPAAPKAVAKAQPTPASTPAVAPKAAAKPVFDPNDPAVKARLAQIVAKKEAEAKAKAEAEARAKANAAPAENPYEMDDESFLAMVNADKKDEASA